MNSKQLAVFGLAAALFSDPLMNRGESREHEPKPSPEPPIPRGCKKYTIDGITVVAISEKHAIKKGNKLKAKKQ